MKSSQIKVGGRYEVKAGRSTTVVKVKSVNKKTGGWKCQTANGKFMNVAAPDRFVKEVTPENVDVRPTAKKLSIDFDATTPKIPCNPPNPAFLKSLFDQTFYERKCCMNSPSPWAAIMAAKMAGRCFRFRKIENGMP